MVLNQTWRVAPTHHHFSSLVNGLAKKATNSLAKSVWRIAASCALMSLRAVRKVIAVSQEQVTSARNLSPRAQL